MKARFMSPWRYWYGVRQNSSTDLVCFYLEPLNETRASRSVNGTDGHVVHRTRHLDVATRLVVYERCSGFTFRLHSYGMGSRRFCAASDPKVFRCNTNGGQMTNTLS